MSKALRIAFILIAIAVLAVWLLWSLQNEGDELPRARLAAALGDAPSAASFERAAPEFGLSFPRDYGAHPDYQTEWWYYTGNLNTADGRRFGYQLTFFRRALMPPDERLSRMSDWAVDQVYLAHFALSDIAGENFNAFEDLARGAAGLAGAQAVPFQVWLYDWQVREIKASVYQLSAAQDGIGIDLTLSDVKGPILQGFDGYSQKGPEPGNASHYFSQTRLETTGQVQIDEERYQVSGTSWMDHEFSTSALSAGQVGWDWFSIQLDNDMEIMAFQIRREDGSIDPFSSLALIYPDGSTLKLGQEDFAIQVLDEWNSPHSGATYPSGWLLSVPAAGLSLEIEPHQVDQELNLSYAYWEGAVGARGSMDGQPVTGNGYVELTGYAGSMVGDF
jgi:predicted secreted hydrolase